MTLATVTLAGLTLGALGSLHCAGMCGPLALACSRAGRSGSALADPALYQLGRIATYVGLGLTFGAFGARLDLFAGQTVASITAGASLLVVGVFGRRIERAVSGGAWLSRAFGAASTRLGVATPIALGTVNGLLPCGLVYTALAASLALGSPSAGAAFMVAFGVATSPALLFAGWFGSRVGASRTPRALFPVASAVAGGLLVFRGVAFELPFAWANHLAMHPLFGCH